MAGAICGGLAAVLYTAANVALRRCVGVDPFLVAAVKAVPTVVLLAPVLVWMICRDLPLLTSKRMLPRFMVVALLGQFVGNAAFQVALESIGLAISVPITLGVLIIGGAILGNLILGEPVNGVKVIAILTLITAIIILSIPGSGTQPESANLRIPAQIGALFAAASGAAYALFGVVMRQTLNGGVSASLTMFISGAVGTVSLWSFTLMRIGIDSVVQTPDDQWFVMLAAGMLNFIAFVALSLSLKALPVVAVNLINASQVAMAAVAGVVLFAEDVTTSMIAGIVLTFVGLAVLAKGRSRRSNSTVPG